jgi:hypothetical protein
MDYFREVPGHPRTWRLRELRAILFFVVGIRHDTGRNWTVFDTHCVISSQPVFDFGHGDFFAALLASLSHSF